MKNSISYKRLESLDVLRGFDLFCLVALCEILFPLRNVFNSEAYESFLWCFTHIEWEGFSPWDLVMPLFMFMSGITIPFALGKASSEAIKLPTYRRILKRFVLLWIFGMMCQGNLLGLNPDKIYFFSNTLQAIAVGYVASAILFLNTKPRTQVITSICLLLIYWALMQFVRVDGYGGGDYTPDGNLAEWIDRTILGRFRDGATVEGGIVVFAPWYRYTWILSSLNFIATVMSGTFAGMILKSQIDKKKKFLYLLYIGIALVALGWLWHFQMPVIKRIWTSSMVLVSSGYCFLLMSLFYYWIDYKGHRKHVEWLKVYGMNSIVAYMLAEIISFGCVSKSLLHGFEQYLGAAYPALVAAANAFIIYIILKILYKNNIFLKV